MRLVRIIFLLLPILIFGNSNNDLNTTNPGMTNLNRATLDSLENYYNQKISAKDNLNYILLFAALSIGVFAFYHYHQNKKNTRRTMGYHLQNKQLESLNKIFTNFLEQSIEAFIVFDSKGDILLWNRANEVITGIKQEDALGRPVWEVGAKFKMLAFTENIEGEKIKLERFFGKMINTPDFNPRTDEVMIEKPDGQIRTILSTYFPVKISGAYYFGIVSSDITERKEYEGALIIAKERAESSDRLKSEFLAQISHEIRTPVNTMLNNVSLLEYELENTFVPEIAESISSINRAGKRMVRTVDLLINLSEVQTSNYNPHPKSLNLIENVLIPISKEYEAATVKKGITLTIKEINNSISVLADEYSVQQIADNLISNAVTYTEKGKIEICTGVDVFKRPYFEVTDTGIGISSAFIPKIFDPFAQEEQGYTRTYEGNGLGLAVVKKYCELNDALISVQSEKGVGSTFRVTFNTYDMASFLL